MDLNPIIFLMNHLGKPFEFGTLRVLKGNISRRPRLNRNWIEG